MRIGRDRRRLAEHIEAILNADEDDAARHELSRARLGRVHRRAADLVAAAVDPDDGRQRGLGVEGGRSEHVEVETIFVARHGSKAATRLLAGGAWRRRIATIGGALGVDRFLRAAPRLQPRKQRQTSNRRAPIGGCANGKPKNASTSPPAVSPNA